MKLPHNRNDSAATKYHEPLYKALFDARMQFPSAVDSSQREIVLDNITSITGLEGIEKMPATITQKFKGVTRTSAGAMVEDTSHEIKIKFNLNLDEANTIYTYKLFRGWSDLIYNPATGERGLLTEYKAGTSLTITIFNKREQVYRTYKAIDLFLKEPIPGLFGTLDFAENGAEEEFEVTFVADRLDKFDN